MAASVTTTPPEAVEPVSSALAAANPVCANDIVPNIANAKATTRAVFHIMKFPCCCVRGYQAITGPTP
jgi:hypothetical protein